MAFGDLVGQLCAVGALSYGSVPCGFCRELVKFIVQRAEIERAGVSVRAGDRDVVDGDAGALARLLRAGDVISRVTPTKSQNTNAAVSLPC